jgi:dihydropteroate synthase
MRRAFSLGPVIVNDVTGMTNQAMIEAVVELQARCIVSQLPATDTQTAHTQQLIDDIEVVKQDLLSKEAELIQRGLPAENIVLDPGIGFGKTPELNQKLLSFAALLPGKRVLIGYSRKRFLGDDRLELAPNLVAGRIAVESGATYLRVHDVAGHRSLQGIV